MTAIDLSPMQLDQLACDLDERLHDYPALHAVTLDAIRAALPGFLAAVTGTPTPDPLAELRSEFADENAAGASSNDIAQMLDGFLTERGYPTVLFAQPTAAAPTEGEEAPTRHTCNPNRPGMPLPFGRKAPAGQCARCDQLRAGAPPRQAPAWIERYRELRATDIARAEEIRRHFTSGGEHETVCVPQAAPHGVTTCYDW